MGFDNFLPDGGFVCFVQNVEKISRMRPSFVRIVACRPKNFQANQGGNPYQPQQQSYQPVEAKPGCLVAPVSFFFPYIGLIMVLAWRRTNPRWSKHAAKWAIWGIVANFVVLILGFIAEGA